MKEIDEYLNLLYKRLNLSDKETADLKAEMRNHLMESVNELKEEGKSDEDSVKIAIERFGDPRKIGWELPGVLTMSRKRFSKFIFIISVLIAALILCISAVYLDNMGKKERLQEIDREKQAAIAEFHRYQTSNIDYRSLFERVNQLTELINHSGSLSEALKAEHNTEVIDKIGEMNKTFKYHNTILVAIAVIASDTGFECPLYLDIAELGVMKLSGTLLALDLAQKASMADTPEKIQDLTEEIKTVKEQADFKTIEAAANYNRSLQ